LVDARREFWQVTPVIDADWVVCIFIRVAALGWDHRVVVRAAGGHAVIAVVPARAGAIVAARAGGPRRVFAAVDFVEPLGEFVAALLLANVAKIVVVAVEQVAAWVGRETILLAAAVLVKVFRARYLAAQRSVVTRGIWDTWVFWRMFTSLIVVFERVE